MPWICRAFDSRQNRGGNRGVFLLGFSAVYPDIVQCICFYRIFARI